MERITHATPPQHRGFAGNMRRLLRAVALINAFYQGVVGAIALLSPIVVSQLFHIGIPEPTEAGVIRLLGSLAIGNALMLGIVARQGDGAVQLARWALTSGVINLVADVVICGAGDLPWSTVMVAMVAQAALVAVLIIWLRTHGAGLPKKAPTI